MSPYASRYARALPVALAIVAVPAIADAHFQLTSPPAMYEQNDLGDPQKAPPCGDNGGAVTTGMITAVQPGTTVTITIDEKVFHPGHYRIALALNDPSELPEEPPVTPGNQACGTTTIMDPPVFPVLADGVFEHTEAFTEPQSIDVTIPADVSCTSCTLQVIQFMSAHGLNNPGGCFYHHCAAISVDGEPPATTSAGDDGGSTDGGGMTSMTTASSADGTADGGGDASATGSDGGNADGMNDDATGGGGSGTGPGPATDPGFTGEGFEDDKGGCACTASRTAEGDRLAMLAAFVGLLGLRRRARPAA